MSRLAPFALLSFLATACTLPARHDGVVVHGVRLKEKHTETIEVGAWDPSGLTIRSADGTVRVEPTTGPSRITVTLHELTSGDASAVHADGRLAAHTESGEPWAIGDVTVYASGPLPALDVETGLGDVRVLGVILLGEVKLGTGLGDVEVRGAGEPRGIEATSGMGSVALRDTSCGRLAAKSGMGDIRVRKVTAAEARLDSGMGDVSIQESHLASVHAETSMGDIDCRRSEIGSHDFHTGMGSVRIP